MKIIDTQFAKDQQGQRFTQIAEIAPQFVVKFEIYRDFYAFQSWARVSLFNKQDRTWNVLHSIHYQLMRTPERPIAPEDFAKDRDTLKRVAHDIIQEKGYQCEPNAK